VHGDQVTRKTTKKGTRPFRCRLCDGVGVGWYGASKRAVAQHIAMTYGMKDRDNVHKVWKQQHGLRVKPEAMGEVMSAVKVILRQYQDEVILGK
jgi:hypothetical protein